MLEHDIKNHRTHDEITEAAKKLGEQLTRDMGGKIGILKRINSFIWLIGQTYYFYIMRWTYDGI